MKIVLLLILMGLNINESLAQVYFYKIEDDDQLGMIFLSLGHRKIWSKRGKINQFKKVSTLPVPTKLSKGTFLKIAESDILLKNNVLINNGYITFKKKLRNLAELEAYQASENAPARKEEQIIPLPVIVEEKEATDSSYSLNFYPGIGSFVANDNETDRSTNTSTFTGLQPLIQIKGIYSNEGFGSLSFDLFAKKIFNDQFSFPVNFDWRLQFVPKWNFTDFFHFAFSHSVIKQSYVGKSSSQEVPYNLNSRFIGFGVVFPRDNYWLELYIEKSYTGTSKSTELTQDVSRGWRVDSEMVYPLSTHWRLLPGINYYKVDSKQTEYSFSALEARLIFSREVEF